MSRLLPYHRTEWCSRRVQARLNVDAINSRNRGSVLILVLWVSLGLVALALTFGHSMMMTYRGADNELAGAQAEQAIEGAARYAEMLMATEEKPGAFPDVTSYSSEEVPVGEAVFWFLGRSVEQNSDTAPVFGLVDESSKLNLNRATAAMLEALPGMTPELAAAIADWADADEDVRTNGAESETYMLRQPPYSCKNAPFESLDELALVNGADPTILYGEDANLNGVLDPNEDDGDKSDPPDNANGRLDPGILEYVTVSSREPKTRGDGTARQDASRNTPELQTYLREKFQTRGDAIVQQLSTVTGTMKSVLEFFINGGLSEDEQEKIINEITVDPEDFVHGRVNINTASETVLASIPGIGPDNASTLVASRQKRAQTGTGIGWIVPILGPQAARLAGPYITGSSYQVTADVAAVGRHGRGYRRTRFVIDMSTASPRIIYRRNLAPLGWALGSEVRQNLAFRKEAR